MSSSYSRFNDEEYNDNINNNQDYNNNNNNNNGNNNNHDDNINNGIIIKNQEDEDLDIIYNDTTDEDENNHNNNKINSDDDEGIPLSQKESNATKVRKHLIGSACILCVVLLWVGSGIVTQIIFTDEDYQKPFFLTYLNSSIFSFYLLGYIPFWKKWTSIPFDDKSKNNIINRDINNSNNSIDNSGNNTIDYSKVPLTTSSTPINTDPNNNNTINTNNNNNNKKTNYIFTFKQILRISLILSPFWFFANYTYNLSLAKTSVSTNTILSTLSGIFSLILSVIFKVDKFTLEKLFATLITLGGIILVSLSDIDKSTNGNDTVIGDSLAIVGAFLYGLYTVLVKKLIGSEENLPMPMMFGFLGLFDFLFLWPLFLIFNLIGFEHFELPTGKVFAYLIVNCILGSFVSDLLDSYSVVMTSPVINSIGLSLSIPFAMISDFVRSHKQFSVMYLMGSALVVAGFLLINLASSVFENKLKSIENKIIIKFKSIIKKD
ncbi:hypothetical protein DICPUDRAFT_156874 [Dictyostelium purpureum]|uniref:Sugar phosphate transporter domain-containing protein n=1 Tax=Dictyostelium purpureum TaxID=5786 RepID=F0ZXN7_DICPU|nr:uncharacterized protein DICPUDRAFT_156874 [Dictyostelium purpureum]EGC31305.1 hypothetical protein DICPUDRAFT_156874 [Dictyostelium purpureum]|eukprot:XP_003292182.1 hypothetical protein DICPUDRAFT_156874 [Dictyostelium purpureum]